jgi:hypothetical protein
VQKSPVTDKHLGVTVRGYDTHSFSELRRKAKEELTERYTKYKRNKAIRVPLFKVDEEVVITHDYFKSRKGYTLVQILDFELTDKWYCAYYGIILKTTDSDLKNRVGRLIKFAEKKAYFQYSYANIKPEDVKWDLN